MTDGGRKGKIEEVTSILSKAIWIMSVEVVIYHSLRLSQATDNGPQLGIEIMSISESMDEMPLIGGSRNVSHFGSFVQ